MNQPSVACGSLIPAYNPPVVQVNNPQDDPCTQPALSSLHQPSHQPEPAVHTYPNHLYDQVPDDFYPNETDDLDQDFAAGEVEYHPNVPNTFHGGKMFMDDLFSDKLATWILALAFWSQYGSNRQLFVIGFGGHAFLYFASQCNEFGLTSGQIKTLTISFQSARQLHSFMNGDVAGWTSLEISSTVPVGSNQVHFTLTLNTTSLLPLKRSGQQLLGLCASSMKIGTLEIMHGNYSALPDGSTLLGVMLSSDKTNISVMSGNHMVHPLLISLANIDADIRSQGALHGHLLLTLLPVPSFIHKTSRVRGLLSDRLFYQCLDFILRPLKVAATVGVMMSDPVGNLCYCYMLLVAYVADTPEQGLITCTSTRASSISNVLYHQFGDNVLYPNCTADQTRNKIHTICSECSPDDYIKFLKYAKIYGLNGVDVPFWVNWPLSSPARFLLPEILHHLHRFFFNHDLQWCITALGSDEINYCYMLIQTLVGYRAFKEGISKLKQVTGWDHRSMQRYIIAIIAGAVPPRFMIAVHTPMDFQYLTQMPSFHEHSLQQLDAALRLFHDHKDSIITIGACSEHFHIPKLELLQHVVPSVRDSGAPMQWSTDVTEHAHIACHLDCADKCFRFDLATRIASVLSPDHQSNGDEDEDNNNNNGGGQEHEPDEETQNLLLYRTPTRKTVNYFHIAQVLASNPLPRVLQPLRTFASSTTAIHLTLKPSSSVSIAVASDSFGLPDLYDAIRGCLELLVWRAP
ncbi:hypothetical protein JVT61DRAFT_13625 [Boletus reticuloceps]|uniref:DUF6830 domain-containing protein n=1 Tax=Boletus reticuloceps TaxID=495285 RepID=A0A8I2YD29_9AGAM|nr:hypothetical protein JVT61DRAFT_13625 [Boletus reticuloceps]